MSVFVYFIERVKKTGCLKETDMKMKNAKNQAKIYSQDPLSCTGLQVNR